MRNRSLAGTLAAAIAAALAVPALVPAQTTSTAKTVGNAQTRTKRDDSAKAATKTVEKKPWKLSYTPDGQPDLQGIWTNLSFTPMARPAKYGNREFLTKEEMDWDFKAGVARSYDTTLGNAADSPFYDATTYALDAWQNGIQPNPRTSLIVDPPNGQFPPLTQEAAKKRAARPAPNPQANAGNAPTKADTAADVGLGVRCIAFGGPPILPSVTNSDLHRTNCRKCAAGMGMGQQTSHHPTGRKATLIVEHSSLEWGLTGTLGKQYVGRGDHQLSTWCHLPRRESGYLEDHRIFHAHE